MVVASACTAELDDQAVRGVASGGSAYDVGRVGAEALAQRVYIKSSNPDSGDWFGEHIVLSGNTLAVAAPRESSAARGVGGDQADDRAPSSGAVYIFHCSGGVWSQQAYLKASNTDAGDAFGKSIALSGDTLVVGAPLEDSAARGVDGDQADGRAPSSGAVYVFRRDGGVWTQEAYLKASNPGTDDWFGASVAVSGDVLAVGAPWEDSGARGVDGDQRNGRASNSGAAYIFRRSGRTWSQAAYLKATNADAEDTFGASMAMSGDTLVVGAPGEDSAAGRVNGDQTDNGAWNSGATYIFQRSGNTWRQVAYIKASNPDAGDWFGERVALSGDLLAVGAPFEDSAATGVSSGYLDDDSASASGAVYLFRRIGGIWMQDAYIKASNTGAGDWFGASVAVSDDTLVVGAPWEASAARGVGGDQSDERALDSGAAYVFRRIGGIWRQDAYIKASNTGAGDWFGTSVAVSGGTLAVGASQESSAARGVGGDQSDERAPGSGASYLFQ